VFFGEARWDDAHEEHGAHGDFHPHESPKIMLLPLVVLAVLSTVGGLIQMPFSDTTKRLEHWLAPVVEEGEHHLSSSADDLTYVFMTIAVVVALGGIALGYLVYQRKRLRAVEPVLLAEGWYYDRAVSDFMGGPGRAAFDGIALADARLVDGAVNGTGTVVQAAAGQARKLQSGNVRNYAAAIGAGVVLLLGWFVIVRGLL